MDRESRWGRALVAVVAIGLFAAVDAGAQTWRSGTFNGQPALFPVDTVLTNPSRFAGALDATVRSLPIRRSIAEAEAEGAAFPWRPATDSSRAASIARHAGTAARSCVRVGDDQSTVRAGDFVVGGGMQRSHGNDVLWSPVHDPTLDAQALVIRLARIDSGATPADTLRRVQLNYNAWFTTTMRARMSPMQSHPLARPQWDAPEPFFVTGLVLPSKGTWLAVATSGSDWACIIVTKT